jgi:hypothetical protein
MKKTSKIASLLVVMLISTVFAGSVLTVSARRPKARLSIEVTASPKSQLAPGTIEWNIHVKNTGDVTFDTVRVYDTRYGDYGGLFPLAPGGTFGITYYEYDLPGGKYFNIYTVIGEYAIGSFVIESAKVSCRVLTG